MIYCSQQASILPVECKLRQGNRPRLANRQCLLQSSSGRRCSDTLGPARRQASSAEKLTWEQQLAREFLREPLPRRSAHVQGVAARARSLAPVLGANADLLEAAAWLHDIGYTPGLAMTGFHPLDGARYLRDAQHADALLCRLVAHHSCAVIEAGERGLAEVLGREFEPRRMSWAAR